MAESLADHLTALADDYVRHARLAAEDIAPAVATVADMVTAEITARDERIRELEARVEHLTDVAESRKQWNALWRKRLQERDERIAAIRSVVGFWEYRTHHGDSGPLDLLADLQAALRDRPAEPTGQDPAATWPSLAARRLEDDAHPTTEKSDR